MGELLQLTTDPYQALTEQPPATERLEADICQLAGNIAAAECRFLILVGEYDARGAWASWDMPSCAAWLAWKCQMSPGTAREHVRVARALRELPVIRGEFAAGRMSYSKARALTRIAEPATETGLTEITRSMTAGQMERFARAHHRCTQQDDTDGLTGPAARQRLSYQIDADTGELSFSGRLPADKAAIVLQALRAALTDVRDTSDRSAQVTADERPEPFKVTPANLAEALIEVGAAYLRGKIVTADNADVYQVVIHTTPEVLAGPGAGVSAETPATHPAHPDRCHIEDGDAIPAWQARKIACTATLQVMLHDASGEVLTVGRRSRTPTPRIRKAVRERDRYRCVFPGCNNRRTDLHHITYWSNGGHTSTDNMCLLCDGHHTLVHQRDYIITRQADNSYTFTAPAGTVLPPAWQLPGADHDLTDPGITPETIYPPVSGERLDLHLAIWIALHNARMARQRSA